MSVLAAVSKTGIRLVLREPFYGHFLVGIPKQESDEVRGVVIAPGPSQQLSVLVNAEYWRKQLGEDAWRYGALKSQLLRVALGHVFRINDYGHRELFGIAADLVAHQYVSPEQLPPDFVSLERFAEARLPPGRSLDYYYRKLMEIWTLAKSAGATEATQEDPDQASREEEQAGEGEKNDVADEQRSAAAALDRLLADESQRDKVKHWGKLASLGRGEQQALRQSIDQLLSSAARKNRRLVRSPR